MGPKKLKTPSFWDQENSGGLKQHLGDGGGGDWRH
jgi:hypothetical protein